MIEVKVHVKTEKALSDCNGNNFTIADLTDYIIWIYSKDTLEIPKLSIGEYGILFNVIDGDGGGGISISKFISVALPNLMLQMQSNSLFTSYPIYELLRLCVEQLNIFINDRLSDNWLSGWLSPALTAAIIKDDIIYFAQIGDTKAYLVRNNNIYHITKEQTLVRQLVDNGQINEFDAKTHIYKNVILQALGATPAINVIISGLKIVNGDIILLCTKEVINKVELNDIKEIVINNETNLQLACNKLIELALIEPATNMTIMLIEIQGKILGQQSEQMVYLPMIERDKNIPNVLLSGELDFDIVEQLIQ